MDTFLFTRNEAQAAYIYQKLKYLIYDVGLLDNYRQKACCFQVRTKDRRTFKIMSPKDIDNATRGCVLDSVVIDRGLVLNEDEEKIIREDCGSRCRSSDLIYEDLEEYIYGLFKASASA